MMLDKVEFRAFKVDTLIAVLSTVKTSKTSVDR